jgi:hypothetical protein
MISFWLLISLFFIPDMFRYNQQYKDLEQIFVGFFAIIFIIEQLLKTIYEWK